MTLRSTSPQAPSVVKQAVVDPRDGFLQVALEHAVELDSLSRGEAEGPVGVGAGQIVHGQVLLGGQLSAGNLAAHHEHVVLADAFLASRFFRASRSSCWYVPWNFRSCLFGSVKWSVSFTRSAPIVPRSPDWLL